MIDDLADLLPRDAAIVRKYVLWNRRVSRRLLVVGIIFVCTSFALRFLRAFLGRPLEFLLQWGLLVILTGLSLLIYTFVLRREARTMEANSWGGQSNPRA